MRKINLLFVSLMLIVSGAVFTSCTKEDDTEGPQISFTNDVEEGSFTGSNYTITGNISSISGLDQVVYYEVKGTNETQLKSETSFTDKNNYNFSVTVPAADITATMYIKVSATDKNEVTNSKSFLIKVETSLTDAHTGKIYHIQAATGNGAWDLVANVAKYSADAAADKDMIQASTNTSGSAWVAGWDVGSGNLTKFVKANTYDYDNATLESAKSTYAAGSASNQIRSVATGDIYIAKLRGGDNYAVIKITNMDPNDATGTGGSNKGSISFSYKK